MRAAIAAVRQREAADLLIAVPAASATTCEELARDGEKVVCLIQAEAFFAVSFWYRHFQQTSDEEVRDLLEQAARL